MTKNNEVTGLDGFNVASPEQCSEGAGRELVFAFYDDRLRTDPDQSRMNAFVSLMKDIKAYFDLKEASDDNYDTTIFLGRSDHPKHQLFQGFLEMHKAAKAIKGEDFNSSVGQNSEPMAEIFEHEQSHVVWVNDDVFALRQSFDGFKNGMQALPELSGG
mgnify:CR=1 FL=1|tara:strand:+ start:78 stop:554 length:477 start_codon:yes stop_codon:yes gene_type:complete